MEILSDMAHGCQCHLKLVSAKPVTCTQDFPSLPCHVYALSELQVQQRTTWPLLCSDLAHLQHTSAFWFCKKHILSPCSEPAPVPHLNTEPTAVAKEHRTKATKGWETKLLTCLQVAEMCPETLLYICQKKKKKGWTYTAFEYKTQVLVLPSLSTHGCCKAFMYGMENVLNTSKDKYQPSHLTPNYHHLQSISPRSAQKEAGGEKNLLLLRNAFKRETERCLYPRTFATFRFLILSKFLINTANVKTVWTMSGLSGTVTLHPNLNHNTACAWLQWTYSQLWYNKHYKPEQNEIGNFKKNTKENLSFSVQGLQGFLSLY